MRALLRPAELDCTDRISVCIHWSTHGSAGPICIWSGDLRGPGDRPRYAPSLNSARAYSTLDLVTHCTALSLGTGDFSFRCTWDLERGGPEPSLLLCTVAVGERGRAHNDATPKKNKNEKKDLSTARKESTGNNRATTSPTTTCDDDSNAHTHRHQHQDRHVAATNSANHQTRQHGDTDHDENVKTPTSPRRLRPRRQRQDANNEPWAGG